MNKIHRTVWNHARQCFVVAHEKARTCGKPSTTRRSIAHAVAAAMLAMGAPVVMAATDCTAHGAITIDGAATGRCVLLTGDSLAVSNTGSVTNSAGWSAEAVIVGGNQSIGSITNSGTILSNHSVAIFNGMGTVSGAIYNDVGAVIHGGWYGIEVGGYGPASVGSITNDGTIIGDTERAILIGGGTIHGAIQNNGTLIGARSGIYMGGGVRILGDISNNGSLVSSNTTGEALGISGGGVTIIGSVTNVDTHAIQVTSNVAGSSAQAVGIAFRNSSNITGGITNAGNIVALATTTGAYAEAYGIRVLSASLLGQGITNSGLIDVQATSTGSSVAVGIDVQNSTISEHIINGGTITAGDAAIRVSSNATIVGGIRNSGTLQTTSTANTQAMGIGVIGATVAGGITNSGTISSAVGIIVDSHATVTNGITNGGTITAMAGINISRGSTVTGGLTNIGAIDSAAGFVIGVGAVVDNVSNSGTISGMGVFLLGGSVSGDIVNTGSMVNHSTFFSPAAGIQGLHATIGGSVINSGTLVGADTGIKLTSTSAIAGGITNSGTVGGGSYAVYADNTSSLSSIHIAGNNTAKFIGQVYAPNTPVTVDGGATYTMDNGQLFAVQSFTNAGTLKIGAGSTGTITGDFSNTGTFSPTVASMSSYGKLNVSGTANLGGTMKVLLSGTPTLTTGGTLTGVIHAGNVVGNFATVTGANSLFTWTANYSATDVDLVIGAGTGGSGGSAGYRDAVVTAGAMPASGAGAALDAIAATDSHNPVVLSFANVSQGKVAEAVKETLPLLTGGTAAATTSAIGSISKVVQARMDGNRGLSSGDSFLSDRHLWFKPFASWAGQDNKSGISGYKSNLAGAAFGGDAVVGDNSRLGAAVAYASADVKGNDNLQRAKVDVYQLIGYGSYSLDANTEVSYQADIGSNINRGRRNVQFMGTTATSNYRSTSYHLGAGIGRTYVLSEATSLTPSLRADYSNVRDGGYSENGAGALNLNVSAHTTEEMLWSADVKLAHKLKDSLTLVANGGFAYDSKAKAASITAAYAGAPGMGFTTSGIKPDTTTWRGGIGVVSTPENGPEITGRYDIEKRNGYTNQTVSAKARWVF